MNYYKSINAESFRFLLNQKPYAAAKVLGGTSYPAINGIVEFYALSKGVVIVASVENLPKTETNIFAFHIHDGTSCGNDFADTGAHYNPTQQDHPNHAGDLPPLFSNNGDAWSAFFDQRFDIKDIIGKVIVIHDSPDDFTTQPAGNSGSKIACGVIEKLRFCY